MEKQTEPVVGYAVWHQTPCPPPVCSPDCGRSRREDVADIVVRTSTPLDGLHFRPKAGVPSSTRSCCCSIELTWAGSRPRRPSRRRSSSVNAVDRLVDGWRSRPNPWSGMPSGIKLPARLPCAAPTVVVQGEKMLRILWCEHQPPWTVYISVQKRGCADCHGRQSADTHHRPRHFSCRGRHLAFPTRSDHTIYRRAGLASGSRDACQTVTIHTASSRTA